MDRRSFFALTGVLGLAPFVGPGCSGSKPPPDPFVQQLEGFRRFVVPPATEPAFEFHPLRQPAPR